MGLFNLMVKYGRSCRGTRRAIGGESGANSRILSGTKQADKGRTYGQKDNHADHIVDVLADVGDETTKRIASKNRCANPEDSAKGIEKQVARIGHLRGASDGRAKRPDDGDEPRKNDRAAAVLFVEIMGPLKMAATEKEGIFAAVESSPSRPANPIAHLVASNGAKHGRQQKPLEGNDASVRKDASGDQERVARKKKTYKEARFNKNDGANERSASGANQLSKSLGCIQRVEKLEDGMEQAERFLDRFI